MLLDAPTNQSDTVKVEFVNMNTDSVWSTQKVPVIIGTSSVEKDNIKTQKLSIFPNPSGTSVTLSLDLQEGLPVDVKIFDMVGKNILHETALLPLQIDLHTYPVGIYDAIVQTKTRRFESKFYIIR